MKLSFHGANREVTGSCHLVECAGKKILIDCGLHQGSRDVDDENAAPFDFDASDIDTVLLTHAHLDHCGRLPLLGKRGFDGEIITTAPSRELARLVLLDSANLQEEEARSRARHAARRGNLQPAGEPLYTIVDALNALDYFGHPVRYGEPRDIAAGIRATFLDAGHILGSASVLLELEEHGRSTRLLFSGDIGRAQQALLQGVAAPPRVDTVVMESTYGDRLHKPLQPSIDELYAAIAGTFRRGGNVIIPTFALERAQELLYFISRGIAEDRLPGATQVYLDSPMAISATAIMGRYLGYLRPEIAAQIRAGQDPFRLPGLHFTRETGESLTINRIRGGAIIIAGSGMCTGGRVRHHLRHNLWRPESSVIFVGYAAVGTPARRIIDGAREVKLLGEAIPVRARIHTINGFSAHADQAELLAWHRATRAQRTVLVHGEEDKMRQFATLLTGTEISIPAAGDVIDL